jgi:Kef-type K+ transport system membrane component KefB
MITVMLVLAAAAAGFGLATWRRLPTAPILLAIGVALSASGILGTPSMLHSTLLLGLTFLVFVMGAELNLFRVGEQLGGAIRVGLAQFAALGGIGIVAARSLGFDWLTASYIGLALTASSTLLIITLLQQRQQLFEPFGRLVVGALLVQDVLVVLLLPILTHIDEGWLSVLWQITATLGLILLVGVCLRWISPWLLLRLGLDEESTLLSVLALMFSFMGLAYLADLPVVIGAFLAGVALSGFPVSGVVRGQLTSLADFFLAVFYVTLGASVTLPSMRQLALDGVMLLSVLLITPPLVMYLARRAGLTMRASIEAAHLLAQCGEFSLVVMLLGVSRGHVSESVLVAMTLLVVVTMTITPFLSTDAVTWQLMRWMPGKRRDRLGERPSGHVLLLGCGRHTRTILERLITQGESVVVIDDDAAVVSELRDRGVMALRGDGADEQLLREAGAGEARVILSTMRRRYDHQRLLDIARGTKVLVRVFSPEAGEFIAARGGTPVVEAEAAAEQFMRDVALSGHLGTSDGGELK